MTSSYTNVSFDCNFDLNIIPKCLIFISKAILGAFAKLRKATISFVMSVRLSVRMEQLDSHLTDFHEI